MGAYMRTNGAVGARNVAQFMAGPYRVPHVKIDSALWMTNKTPVGTYRGPGRFEANFFLERMIDMIAADLGIDRIEFRRTQSDHQRGAALSDRAPCSRPTPRTSTTAAIIAPRSTARCKEIDWPKVSKLAGQADRRQVSRPRRRSASSRAAPPARRRPRGSKSTTTAPSRSISARPRSGRASRRSSRRSPPTRWKCRSSASATSITARPPT